MPVHDWSGVNAGLFHDFHQSWIVELTRALNGGILPKDYYALSDQHAKGPVPDVVTLHREDREVSFQASGEAIAVAERPPQVAFVEEIERDLYAQSAARVVVFHSYGDEVVAAIEIVSSGNKHSIAEKQDFCDKLTKAIEIGVHQLVIDIHPPGRHDPRGMHYEFWNELYGEAHGVTAEQPVGVSSYCAKWCDDTFAPTAYFQPVPFGRPLPDMPLFLAATHYVNVPLDETYQRTWNSIATRVREVVLKLQAHS